MELEKRINYLREKGVNIPAPHSLEIGEEVNLDRISTDGVTLHSGCRLFGKDTLISKGCTIGREGPATIDSCWLGPHVAIKGGFVQGSVFLEKSSVGYGSHVREGSIFEEQASVAHCVGLKQTILFPFVTLGSLINFCDCLMAGGTDRKNHSEVGSSYIHFNYTPNQDKATPSLLGDVPRGVMLNNRPIFLGGQGGMVGPVSLNYGTVIAAGTIQRSDEEREGRLLFGGALRPGNIKHSPGAYQNVGRIINHNITYIAHLIALSNWYDSVRSRCISSLFPQELAQGLNTTINKCIDERIKRLKGFIEKVADLSKGILERSNNDSASLINQKNLIQQWPVIASAFDEVRSKDLCPKEKDVFLNIFDKTSLKPTYIETVKNMDEVTRQLGTTWLKSIVESVEARLFGIIPEL